MRRVGWLAPVLALAGLGCIGPEGPMATDSPLLPPVLASTPGRPAALVLASVTGLSSADYGPDGVMPTLRALARAGVASARVEAVTPESSYPVHASLVTGQRPARHGILADRLITEQGLARARPWQAERHQTLTLWDALAKRGQRTAAFDWPSTQGAALSAVLPDGEPVRRGESWLGAIAATTTPWLLVLAKAAPPTVARPGPERDHFLVQAACTALRSEAPPRLVLLRLRGPEAALAQRGPGSESVRAAFAAVDGELAALLDCLAGGPGVGRSALVVTGDRGFRDVHTAVRPNRILAHAGLLAGEGAGWSALARSNGGSAYVYARDAKAAVAARVALADEAETSGAFRVVSAEEMITRGADPEAWFGLEAAAGFAFLDDHRGPVLAPARLRATGGYLQPSEVTPGFVAWGQGFRSELRIPSLHQLDVAPTLARLLDVPLPDTEGRALIGLLRVPGPVAAGPPAEGDFE